MLTITTSGSYTHELTNALVERALNKAQTTAVYSVYRKLEAFAAGGRQITLANAGISAACGLSPSTVSKALQVLRKLGVIDCVYPPDGDKRHREIVLHAQLTPQVEAVLRSLAAVQASIDVGSVRVPELQEPSGSVRTEPSVSQEEEPATPSVIERPFSKSTNIAKEEL